MGAASTFCGGTEGQGVGDETVENHDEVRNECIERAWKTDSG
jgi:hypothetical protein